MNGKGVNGTRETTGTKITRTAQTESQRCTHNGFGTVVKFQNKNVRNSPSTANDVICTIGEKFVGLSSSILGQKPRRISTDELSPQRTKLGEPTQYRFEIKS
uniref:Uncharacterized protein n=1 Tax=Cucumis melo TaxID=3656 RepID=A0A9I9DDY6_CUCME